MKVSFGFVLQAKREMEAADAMMREIIDVEAELKAHQTTLASISNDVTRQEEIVSFSILPPLSDTIH